MWTHLSRRAVAGVTLFEGMVTALLIFVILSAVTTLLQSSLRALKSQQGRELSEVALLHDMIRRELGDAVTVSPGVGALALERGDPELTWEQLRTRPELPDAVGSVPIRYTLLEGKLLRQQGSEAPEPLMALRRFDSAHQTYYLRLDLELEIGKRVRPLVWNLAVGEPML